MVECRLNFPYALHSESYVKLPFAHDYLLRVSEQRAEKARLKSKKAEGGHRDGMVEVYGGLLAPGASRSFRRIGTVSLSRHCGQARMIWYGMGQSQIENAVVSTFFITEFTIQK